MYYLDIGLCTTLTTLTMYYPHYLGNVLPGHWTMYYLERRASCKERLIAVELILSACKYQISHLNICNFPRPGKMKILFVANYGFVAASWSLAVLC